MKTTQILTILVVALVLMIYFAEVSEAVPMGTAWTYQGRLMDANDPADGIFDFEFKLYDAYVGGNKAANDVNVGDVDVIDGYFTVELDFGSDVFDGNARWLEIGVRPGDSTGGFTTLSPRQEVTPIPYALQTRGVFVDPNGNVGIGTRSPAGRLHVGTPSSYSDVIYTGECQDDLSVDLGSAYTGDIDRTYIVEVTDSEGGPEKFKWSDDNGATWSSEDLEMTTSWYDLSHGVRIRWDETDGHCDGVEGPVDSWAWVAYHGHEDKLVVQGGNVGIGTTSPGADLHVRYSASGHAPINVGGLFVESGGVSDSSYIFQTATTGGGKSFSITNAGNVGIGTTSPSAKLDVQVSSGGAATIGSSGNSATGDSAIAMGYNAIASGWASTAMGSATRAAGSRSTAMGSGTTASGIYSTAMGSGIEVSGAYSFGFGGGGSTANVAADNVFVIDKANVGIGTVDPQGGLHVSGNGTNGIALIERSGKILALNPNYGGKNQFAHITTALGSGMGLKLGVNEQTALTIRTDGNVGIGTTSPAEKLTVRGNLLIQSESTGASVLELGEGLDYAEGFDVSEQDEINAGSVLIIDADNPGKLALSNKSYDTKVAGIVAGGKGLGSGVRLGAGQYDYDVALAGRVYCKVDASDEAVQAGDLLTTSAMPGYAMKAVDYMRAQGAILGKAMESLEKGQKGQILVLVTLQ